MSRNSTNYFQQIFSGAPIPLRWGPWHTDTRRLHYDNWKFYADEYRNEEQFTHVVHLVAKNPEETVAISGNLWFSLHSFMGDPYQMAHNWYSEWDRKPVIMHQFNVQRDVFRTITSGELSSWMRLNEIDVTSATSMRFDTQERMFPMKDFKIFQQKDNGNSIYIPEKSVDKLFNEILKIQYPEQQEIKKRLIVPEQRELVQLQARVFSL